MPITDRDWQFVQTYLTTEDEHMKKEMEEYAKCLMKKMKHEFYMEECDESS